MKLAQEGILQEMRCGTNVSYVLSDSNLFFLTGFKVLQGLEKNGFLRCVKASLNGKIQLVYLTHTDNTELKSLKAMMTSIDASAFAVILRNWVAGIAYAKTVGFLHCPNIVTAIDHVFVDPKTYEVYQIYLPIMEFCAAEDILEFETELRASLVQLIDSTPGFRVGAVLALRDSLIDGSKTLEDIVRTNGSGIPTSGCSPSDPPSGGGLRPAGDMPTSGGMSGPTLTLDAAMHATPFHYVFQPRRTTIGRAGATPAADVQIPGNPYIGGMHCFITFENGSYYVVDMNSRNKTYLNGRRLDPNVRELLRDGDEIRIANSTFRVMIA